MRMGFDVSKIDEVARWVGREKQETDSLSEKQIHC